MAPIATYVFVDLETTGLPREDNNKTRITEFSMIAVKRAHVLDTRPGAVPRVQHKLTLLLNPGRQISTAGTEITGLDNFLLEYEPTFNIEVFNLMNNFLNILEKPVCLIAQNGLNFDYPILKNHLEKLNVSFSEDLLCADCYHGFYDILEGRKMACTIQEAKKKEDSSKEEDITPAFTSKEGNATSDEDNTTLTANEKLEFLSSANMLSMKAINETTPKQQKSNVINHNVDKKRAMKTRRRLPFSLNNKPTEKYKLKHVYERVLQRSAIEAHRAENDCILALEVSVALGRDFVEWVDNNCGAFSEVNAMRFGVRLGD